MCYINSINTLMYGFNFFCPKSKDGYEKSYYGFIWFIVLLRTYLIIGKTTYLNSFKMPKVFCTLILFLQTIFCLYFVYNFLSSLLRKELHHRNQSQSIDITSSTVNIIKFSLVIFQIAFSTGVGLALNYMIATSNIITKIFAIQITGCVCNRYL